MPNPLFPGQLERQRQQRAQQQPQVSPWTMAPPAYTTQPPAGGFQRPAGGFPNANPSGYGFMPGQGPLPNAQSPSGFGQLDPKGKGDREARSWTTDFDFLWRSFGPERAQELMNMMAQFQNQQTAPAMQGYQQALGQYDQAYPAYQQAMQGVGQQYQQGMQGLAGQYEKGMGGVGQDYASRMQQMAAMYAKQMGGAFQPAQQAMQQAASREYGAGLGAIGQGQNQINQSLASQAARSGMGGTGVGQARTALGSAAGAFMMPQLQSQLANRQNEIAQFGYGHGSNLAGALAGMQGQTAGNLMGLGQQATQGLAGIRQAGVEGMYGHGSGVAGAGLNFAGQRLGAQQDWLGTQLGQNQQAQQMALQNLYARMGMMPNMWDIRHQQENQDFKNKYKGWGAVGGILGGPIGSVLGSGLMAL